MKMRLLPTLVGLAIGFAVPVLAQEQNTVDPEVRQQIEASIMKADEAFNRSDAAGCTAEYTQDAIAQLPVGTLLLFSGFISSLANPSPESPFKHTMGHFS
jgi:hypothetical protein